MSYKPTNKSLTAMYDHALRVSPRVLLAPGTPRPCFSREWLAENIAVLERYYDWLIGGGTSLLVTRTYHIPMAGHILGMNHKPSNELDLDQDLEKAHVYICAKGLSASWNNNCRNSLRIFRRFLLQERGRVESRVTPYHPAPHTEGLPAWLVTELTRYQQIQQRNWREARIEQSISRFWGNHLRIWRFLVEQKRVNELVDLRRSMVLDYIDLRLQAGRSVRSINYEVRILHAFLVFLLEQEMSIPRALLRICTLKQPDSLPKFLTDEQVRALKQDFECRVRAANDTRNRRDALLDRACFYLLWQSALRVGEVEDLRLEDLDLAGKRLTVRKGKGRSDRSVFLTETTVEALKAYLLVRGVGPTEHVFLYRNQALSKTLVAGRIRAAGKRVGLKVHPHRLRHTAATQLLNAGCRITSIQKLLGHRQIGTTLINARVHDQTVADDYYQAMGSVEKRLELMGQPDEKEEPVSEDQRGQIMALTEQLAEPELSLEARLVIAAQIRLVLLGEINSISALTPAGGPNANALLERAPPSLFHCVTF